jgi:hypothetical protein
MILSNDNQNLNVEHVEIAIPVDHGFVACPFPQWVLPVSVACQAYIYQVAYECAVYQRQKSVREALSQAFDPSWN